MPHNKGRGVGEAIAGDDFPAQALHVNAAGDWQVDPFQTRSYAMRPNAATATDQRMLVLKYLANKSDHSAMFCIPIVRSNRWTSGWDY